MPAPTSAFANLVRMLESFVEGQSEARGTIFVRELEGEFASVGLDDEEEFFDLKHALAMYRGHEADIRVLEDEASSAIQRLRRT